MALSVLLTSQLYQAVGATVEPVFSARFEEGEARADRVPIDTRMSRIWSGSDRSAEPSSSRGNRLSIHDGISENGRKGYAYRAATDAAFRALGGFNAAEGTFAVWVDLDSLSGEENVLFSAHSMLSGGPHPMQGGATRWAIGLGDGTTGGVPKDHLYLANHQHQLVTRKPVRAKGWVFIAAVWALDSGMKLYVNGDLVASDWRMGTEAGGDVVEKQWFPQQSLRNASEDARLSVGTDRGRKWHSLSEAAMLEEVAIDWTNDAISEKLYIESHTDERVQIRFQPIRGVPGTETLRMKINLLALPVANATAAGSVSLRLTARPQNGLGETQYYVLRVPSAARGEWVDESVVLSLPEVKEKYDISLDLNLVGKGIYRIRSIAVESGEFNQDTAREWINNSAGVRWTWSSLHGETYPTPVDRLWVRGYPSAPVYDAIYIYDRPLSAQGIQQLMQGQLTLDAATSVEETWLDAQAARHRLGWGDDSGGFIPIGNATAVVVREPVIERVYEDRRLAGWLAVDGREGTLSPWWYHGYRYAKPRRLHYEFEGDQRLNFARVRGDMTAVVNAGGDRDHPDAGQEWFQLDGSSGVSQRLFDETVTTSSVSVAIADGQVSGLHFYEVLQGNDYPQDAAAQVWFLGSALNEAQLPLDAYKAAELVSGYVGQDRTAILLQQEPADAKDSWAIDALHALHLLTPQMEEDFALAAIGFKLGTTGLKPGSRLQLRINDSVSIWRELGRLDFVYTGEDSAPQWLDFTVDLRDTIIPSGASLQLTLIFEDSVELLASEEEYASRILLHRAEQERAMQLWKEWHLADWRNAFEAMSEPRPWRRMSSEDSDNWWLRGASPEYDHMHRVGSLLLGYFPDDPRVAAWYNFIHPMDPNPAMQVELPAEEGHPRWAELARANLKLYHHFVDYWTRERVDPKTGELGNWVGDDTDLLQDWVDMALIYDPENRYRNMIRYLADGFYDRYVSRGSYYIVDGLNARWTDGLHAYEDGLNVQPMGLILEYGDPVIYRRLLETAARYDGFLLTEEQEGMRAVNTQRDSGGLYWSSTQLPVGSVTDRTIYLPLHAGLVLLWYNEHPDTLKVFEEFARWNLNYAAEHPGWSPDTRYGGWTFYFSLYKLTGNPEYLQALIDVEASVAAASPQFYSAGQVDPSWLQYLPEQWLDPEVMLVQWREDADVRYDELGTYRLGFSDSRYEKNWLEWKLSGDEAYLLEGLEALYRRLQFTMPVSTVAEQSGDRVSIPKQLVSMMYLGGVPAARNTRFYPHFAVSYEGLSLDFAAWVQESTSTELKVLFYNFEGAVQDGAMRVWNLEPGLYRVRSGLAGEEGTIETPLSEYEVELARYAPIELKLPSQQLYRIEIEQLQRGVSLAERADLALGADSVQYREDGGISVQIYNLGQKSASEVEVQLLDENGEVLASTVIAEVQGVNGYAIGSARIDFAAELTKRAAEIALDPADKIMEITRVNNRRRLPTSHN